MTERNKDKIFKLLTKDWQTTKQVADKYLLVYKKHTRNQNIVGFLFELFVDDKKIRRRIMPYGKSRITYWRLK